jgi:hypothetical protein
MTDEGTVGAPTCLFTIKAFNNILQLLSEISSFGVFSDAIPDPKMRVLLVPRTQV